MVHREKAMFLGPFQNLHEMLEREFGPDHYTDDNAVVDGNSEDQANVALLFVTKPDTIRIEYSDGRKPKLTYVLGCRLG